MKLGVVVFLAVACLCAILDWPLFREIISAFFDGLAMSLGSS